MATRPAENPVGLVARKLHIGGVVKEAPKLSLPGKLVFPSLHNSGHFSMLGLGDIVSDGGFYGQFIEWKIIFMFAHVFSFCGCIYAQKVLRHLDIFRIHQYYTSIKPVIVFFLRVMKIFPPHF